MRWTKQGRIFEPPNNLSWMTGYAALPVALQRGEHHRVYFSGRDAGGRAQIGYFELALERPETLLAISESPVLGLGRLGAFDDSGVTLSCLVPHGDRLYLYYSGWSRGVSVPFYFYVGLAVSHDGGERFHRVSDAPVLERNAVDPYLTASPFVLIENGIWRMWYVSCTHWTLESGQPKHHYHIRYAESADGIHWQRDGRVCIDFASEDEHAIARPFVLKEDGRYKMWYSYRGTSYRLGYAESLDGLTWQRQDERAGMDVSINGWDTDMLAYPFIVDHLGSRYMLYNGNGYGQTGIGLAKLSKE